MGRYEYSVACHGKEQEFHKFSRAAQAAIRNSREEHRHTAIHVYDNTACRTAPFSYMADERRVTKRFA